MSDEKKKKSNSRSSIKYPNLIPHYNLSSRWEEIDYDYVDKLSEKDKEWLDKFSKEFIGASLDTKNLKNNLHNTKELKKACQDKNNARNRCILTQAKAKKDINYIEDLSEEKNYSKQNEDHMINKIDKDNLKDRFKAMSKEELAEGLLNFKKSLNDSEDNGNDT